MGKFFRFLKQSLALNLVLLIAVPVVAADEMDGSHMFLRCGAHNVEMTYAAFTWEMVVQFDDPELEIAVGPGSGATKLYEFDTLYNINGYECIYRTDGGEFTQAIVSGDAFGCDQPIILPCPSPGGVVYPLPSEINENSGFIVVSDRSVLLMGDAGCFEFSGDSLDYTCVLWYCEFPFEPVFHITSGCDDPCDDPACTPAIFDDVSWGPACNPVDNIWCRVFWPTNLTQPGCWCYYFEYQLPVELQSFEAEPLRNAVRLNWTTGTEQNNRSFILERSTSDAPWTEIARINGQGNSMTATSYAYVDENVSVGTAYRYRLKSLDFSGVVEELSEVLAVPLAEEAPEGYSLAQNYPNPFNAVTELSYMIADAGHVRLAVYDITGRLVATLVNEEQGAGEYRVTFDAGDLPSGVYIYSLKSGAFAAQQKMVLLK